MGVPVEQFIRDVHKRFNVKYVLTAERVRAIRTKLRLAEISGEVSDEDVKLAQDIVLADYNMGSSSMRTASATGPHGVEAHNIRNAGMCPRCHHGMQFAKLAESEETRYCANCHVCVLV